MPFLILLLSLFATPVLAQEVSFDPARVAYESQLHTRLGELGLHEQALRNSDEARRCRRWKIMGFVFGGISVAAMYPTLIAGAFMSDDGQSTRERAVVGGILGGLALGAATGFGFAIASRVTNPTREPLRAIRIEQKQIRRELRRRADERAWRLSLDGLAVRF